MRDKLAALTRPRRLLVAAGALLLLAGALLAGQNLLTERRAARQTADLLASVETRIAAPADLPAPEVTGDPWAGYEVIGVVGLPDLGLSLPVLADYTQDLLAVAPCRYTDDLALEPGQLVVAGHNYRTHFGRLGELAPGSRITWQNLDGVTYTYTVTEVTEIDAGDREALEQGDWDLTLFTCDVTRTRRILVRAALEA